ncbi:MAG TPA: hypothetical protein VJN22_01325 [Candidatus Eremiobacteraceae bacterium]|nr:hypothetical protein [Candidatus Eremiobacteraceae bacterium]
MRLYQRTQFGSTAVILVGAIAGFISIMAWITDEPRWLALATLAFLILVLTPLTTMTIRVTPSAVEWWFSFGIAHQRLAISEVRGVRVMRTSLLSGLGIHGSGDSVLWAVSGSSALGLELSDGRLIGLSTNEPQVVVDVIKPLLATGGNTPTAR